MPDEKLSEIVNRAVSGEYDLPELQRNFVWRRDQVVKLCDSLFRDYPIGTLLAWDHPGYRQPRSGEESRRKPFWIVDGQQRITSACLLFGRKPYWSGPDEWAILQRKMRVYANINEENQEVNFGSESRASGSVSIPVDEILTKRDDGEVVGYLLSVVGGNSERFRKLIGPVNRIRNFHSTLVPMVRMDAKEPEDVAEIFDRFNTAGTRLKETDIRLALIAVFNPGWVRDKIHPFLEDLDESGWPIPPGYLLQAMTISSLGKARMRDVPDSFWQSQVQTAWESMHNSVTEVVLHLWDKGVPTIDLLPSTYTLIPLFAIHSRFSLRPDYSFQRVYQWFLTANLQSRYSGAPLEILTVDAQAVYEATSLDDCLERLQNKPAPTVDDLTNLFKEEFRKGTFPALLLHLLLWERSAKDWLLGISIKGQSQARRSGRGGVYQSHWHHILPKSWARNNKYEGANAVANVTLITESTNVRKLAARPPWDYVPRNNIGQPVMEEHFIPGPVAHEFVAGHALTKQDFDSFVDARANLLGAAAAKYMGIQQP